MLSKALKGRMIYMLNTVYQLIRTARPRQWLKNLVVFAPVLFTGQMFVKKINVQVGKEIYEKQILFFPTQNLILALWAFVVFCILSSAAYFMNDIIDAKKDSLHPIKKNRPIPSGKLSKKLAGAVAFTLVVMGIFLAYTQVGRYFTLICVAYLLLQVAYSFYFRHIIILDSLVVASGFVLRLLAGGVASFSSISSWLLLTTIGLSLLLAFGKRRSEKTILAKYQGGQLSNLETRATLRHYPDSLLDSMISTSASFCLITYSLFTFQTSPEFAKVPFSKYLPAILSNPKWLMITIPIVFYGVARYLYVIYEKGGDDKTESPERVLLSDKPILFTVILWALAVILIIYGPFLLTQN